MSKKVWEVIDLLEENGWQYLRTRGDHHKFKKPGSKRSVIVPGKRNGDLPEGTYKAILREAGLK
ncbi:MAG: type II toxin-antitoxin system HicA family toxin [Bacteroidales bacterium]|nr:type II toxin-antitoxin system HicA family toxin [Bacteroidales bacterium]